MKRHVFYLFFIVFVSGMFFVSAAAQNIEVSGKLNDKCLQRGEVYQGFITISIPKQLHINSNTPSSEYLIPTTVEFTNKSVKIEKIFYPKGTDRKFAFSETPINIYEGEVVIEFSFRVLEKLETRDISINAAVNYQACTEEVCYQPVKKELLLSAQVK